MAKATVSLTTIAEAVADKTGTTKAKTRSILESAIAEILESAKGAKVSIHRFGSFEVVDRKEKKGRNPKTGETMRIPSHRALKFHASKSLEL